MPEPKNHPGFALALLATTFLTHPISASAAPGDALGPEFQINSFTTSTQWIPSLAMDADGDFVVAWESLGQDGDGYGVFAQRYDAAGNPVGGEFQINSFTTGRQFAPTVAMDADGDFVVAWGSEGQDGNGFGVFARRYDAAGNPVGGEFQVNSFTTGHQFVQTVAMDADGDFVVAWESSADQDGSSYGVFARRYDAAGDPVGGEFQVNSYTTSLQILPTVAMDADGNFVVAWVSDFQDGSSFAIFARRYDAAGDPVGGEFQVNSYTFNTQNLPAVAMDADGDFVVTWASVGQDLSSWGVFAQRYDAAGNPVGGEFRVNSFTASHQSRPSVAMDADGDFVVAWGSEGQDGDSWGIFAQRYQGDGPVAGDFTVDGRADILWRNAASGNTNLWQMDGFDKLTSGSIGGAGTDWQVRALADFNADTKTDVLWRNTTTGSTVIWLMDGFSRLASGGIGAPGLDWAIAGAGDVDGDDHADILWRNVTTGANVIWLMDGLTRSAAGGIGGVPLTWEVAGLGDFDADARSDILWRNTGTGAALIWLMDGFSKAAIGGIGSVPPVWEVAGVGAFNGDARSDILWRNTDTGSTVIWQMNGLAKDDAAGIGMPPLVWRIEGVGDTDGDRRSDIIWRNSDTGQTVIWRMDGFITDATGAIGGVPLVWEVQ